MKANRLILPLSFLSLGLLGISVTAAKVSVSADVSESSADTKVRANFGKLMTHSIFNPKEPATKVDVTTDEFHTITGQEGPMTLDEIPKVFNFGTYEKGYSSVTYHIPETIEGVRNWPADNSAQHGQYAVQVSDFRAIGGYSVIPNATSFKEVDDQGNFITGGKVINGGIITLPGPNKLVQGQVEKFPDSIRPPSPGGLDESTIIEDPATGDFSSTTPTIIYAGNGDSNPLLTGVGAAEIAKSTGKGSWAALYNPADVTLRLPEGAGQSGKFKCVITWILVPRTNKI